MYGNALKYPLEDYWNLGLLVREQRSALTAHVNKIHLTESRCLRLLTDQQGVRSRSESSEKGGKALSGKIKKFQEKTKLLTIFKPVRIGRFGKLKEELKLWKEGNCTIRKPHVTGNWKLYYPSARLWKFAWIRVWGLMFYLENLHSFIWNEMG